MKKYSVYTISGNKKSTIRPGENWKGSELFNNMFPTDREPDRLTAKDFDNEEEAKIYFDSLKPSSEVRFNTLYLRAVFFEENEVDEDGEFIELVNYEEKFEDIITAPYIIRSSDTWDFIESFDSLEEAENELAIFERQDEEDGTYTEDFYQIAAFNSDSWEFEEI